MAIVHELNLPYNVVRQSLHDNPNVTVRSQGRVMSTEIDLIPLFERIYNNELSIIDACDQNSLCRSTIYRRYAQWKRSKNSK
jgi:GMP synthase PP-ATPase subunit